MVAYSFKGRFEAAIRAGVKRQTIRKVGKKRHARAGERITMTTGDRFHPRQIGQAVCRNVGAITLDFRNELVTYAYPDPENPDVENVLHLAGRDHLDLFARVDGFESWPDLCLFWAEVHGSLDTFTGLRITWDDFQAARS
ncbi:hypothetical protein BBAL3_2592 [Brevundimonas sp. BAL3]|uniref:ASCH domain-containing protein n=1 Tax=Brevundimonas sp. BAL3 TaxID=391600 RepID=UPI00017EBEB0|nr:ASCH domain-containing protein [Brevundimonas sp. BAL3]EDX81435.1 hypothetical protein BBAL3_2592 [Brevundimonas sp. BAL3]